MDVGKKVNLLTCNEKVEGSIPFTGTTFKMPDSLGHFSWPPPPQQWRAFGQWCEFVEPCYLPDFSRFSPAPRLCSLFMRRSCLVPPLAPMRVCIAVVLTIHSLPQTPLANKKWLDRCARRLGRTTRGV